MSSRSQHNESRYIPRDRNSPPRYSDRRPSGGYNGPSSYRGGGGFGGKPFFDANSGSPFSSRDVPRGPKALVDPGGGSSVPSGPRSRGFGGRPELRELRDAPPLSDSRDKSWRDDDFDRRDRRPSPRGRSPSRGRHDTRDYLPREIDVGRARRGSRDGPLPAGSNFSEPLRTDSYRGGFGRGRGRGDWNYRGRGRGAFHDDRSTFRRSRSPSRSRGARREQESLRDSRDFDRRDEYRSNRFDEERRTYRDDREDDRFRREPALARIDTQRVSGDTDSRYAGGTSTGHSTPHSMSASTAQPPNPDRTVTGEAKRDYEPARKSSIVLDSMAAKDGRREPEMPAYLAGRAEASRERYGPRGSPPLSAPQVPAFGSIGLSAYRPPTFGGPTSNVWINPKLDKANSQQKANSGVPTAPKEPPTAPKAQLSAPPPTGPKATTYPLQGSTLTQSFRPEPAGGIRTPTRPFADGKNLAPTKDDDDKIKDAPIAPKADLLAASSPHVASGPMPERSSFTTSQPTEPPASPVPKLFAPPTGPSAGPKSIIPTASAYDKSPRSTVSGRDGSPASSIPTGPRSLTTSPRIGGMSIPTGPKAERGVPVALRAALFTPSERMSQVAPRAPMMATPAKSLWTRPSAPIYNRSPVIPAKRDSNGDEKSGLLPAASISPAVQIPAPISEPDATAASRKNEMDVDHGQGARSKSAEPSKTSATLSAPTTAEPTLALSTSASVPMDDVSMDQTQPRISRGVELFSPRPAPDKSGPKTDSTEMVEVSKQEREAQQQVTTDDEAADVHSEDGEEDEGLNEEYFAEAEAKFNRERARLESKKADLSLPNLRATSPLGRLSLLSTVTAKHLPSEPPAAVAETAEPQSLLQTVEPTAMDMLTPKEEEIEDTIMHDGYEDRERSPAQSTTPDTDPLPYLAKGPPTPLSNSDQEVLARFEESKNAVFGRLCQMRAEVLSQQESHRDIFKQSYQQWRMEVEHLEKARVQEEEQERQKSAEPGASIPEAAPIAVPPAVAEGRRAHRFNSEYDYQLALKESMETEREAQAKRAREAGKAKADMEKEAILPQVLGMPEIQYRRFKDTNRLRRPEQAASVFSFEPPEDDFTEAEHKTLVQNYLLNPKKWSLIAQALPGRDYKQCINHYYATKWEREYKAKDRRKKGAKGRGRGGAQPRGRASALVSAMGVRPDTFQGDEFATPVVAITDSGRPKRAAAPTWPPKDSDVDQTPSAATPARKTGAARADNNGEPASEKPARRQKSTKERAPRKTKNQPLAARPMMSPQKLDKDRKEHLQRGETEDWVGTTEAAFRSEEAVPPALVPQYSDEDQAMYRDSIFSQAVAATAGPVRPKLQTQQSRSGASSYWSVQEEGDFKKLIPYFGTDFNAISQHMGTKTATMVKNHYMKIVEQKKHPEIEEAALLANERRQRGDDIGPPPTLSAVPRRRYDTSQPAVPRTLAPNPDVVDLEHSPPSQPLKASHASPPQYQAQPRVSGMAQSTISHVHPVPATQSHVQSQVETASQAHVQQPRTHHRLQGPKMGYFSDSRNENKSAPQSSIGQRATHLLQQSRLFAATTEAVTPSLQAQHHQQSQSQPQPQPRRPSLFGHQASDFAQRSDFDLTYRQTAAQQQERDYQLSLQSQRVLGRPQHRSSFSQLHEQSMQAQALQQQRNAQAAAQHIQEQRTTPSEQSVDNMQPPQSSIRHLMDAPTHTSHMPQSLKLSDQQPHPSPPIRSDNQVTPSIVRATPQPYAQAPVQAHAQSAPAPRPEPRKTSNILSILNSEPEEPRPRKREPEPVAQLHTQAPSQQPAAPPTPTEAPQSVGSSLQRPSSRPPFFPSAQPQIPVTRPASELSSRDSNLIFSHRESRESWLPRQPLSQPSAQQSQASSPHTHQAQPSLSEIRHSLFGSSHRTMAFGGLQNPTRQVVSPPPPPPPPQSIFSHSRTPSYNQQTQAQQPPPQQPLQQPSAHSPAQAPAAAPAQFLHRNPYAQVQPPQPSQPQSLPQQMSRNEQAHAHNQSYAFGNAPTQDQQTHRSANWIHSLSGFSHDRQREAERDEPHHSRDHEREMQQQQRRDLAFGNPGAHRYGRHTPQPLPHEQQQRFPPPPPRNAHTPSGRLGYAAPSTSQEQAQQDAHSRRANDIFYRHGQQQQQHDVPRTTWEEEVRLRQQRQEEQAIREREGYAAREEHQMQREVEEERRRQQQQAHSLFGSRPSGRGF